ncbi:MAG: GAF domain-containing protein [Actinobacteria bacterium]|nr:GAF domain-containing protein [Actinomycetota bacterium]
MTATDVSLMPFVMHLSRTRASRVDVRAMLGAACSAISGVVGVGGVVVLLVEPLDGCRISASDGRAGWIGDTQLQAEVGPMPGALRTGRPMLTVDITRIGPPAMAAAAAECGLTSSLVVPFGVDGERVGVLQLLGEAHRPVEPADAELVRPLLEVLAARLADVRDLRRARASRSEPKALLSVDAMAVAVSLPRQHAVGHEGIFEPAKPVETFAESEAMAALPAAPSQDPTGHPLASAASSSTTPRAFAPRPSPRPRIGRHSL